MSADQGCNPGLSGPVRLLVCANRQKVQADFVGEAGARQLYHDAIPNVLTRARQCCYIPSDKSLTCFYDLRMHSLRVGKSGGAGLQPWPQLQLNEVRSPIIQMSSDLELASSPRPVFFRLPAPTFLTASPEGGPMLTSSQCNPANPLLPAPTRRRGPRAIAWHAHYHRCGACSDKQHAMRWP